MLKEEHRSKEKTPLSLISWGPKKKKGGKEGYA